MSLLAYHSQLVHPVALHVEEHCNYLMGEMQKLTALVHEHGLLASLPSTASATPPPHHHATESTQIEERIHRLEKLVDLALSQSSAVPVDVSISAAQRVAVSRRGSRAGSVKSHSVPSMRNSRIPAVYAEFADAFVLCWRTERQ